VALAFAALFQNVFLCPEFSMNIVSDAFLAQKSKSKSAKVRSLLNYPVIDTDIHTIDFAPLLEDYIAKYGGVKLVDQVRAHLKEGLSVAAGEWYGYSPDERRNHRLDRPPFWALPARNTKDLATAILPKLLYERLQEQGSDYAILYPNITLFPIHSHRDDLRRVLARAINHLFVRRGALGCARVQRHAGRYLAVGRGRGHQRRKFPAVGIYRPA
jgi:hypothetical protein